MKFNKNDIFRLIASNKVNEALTKLLDLVLKLGIDANSYKHELTILSNRYYSLNQRKSNGTIKQDELEVLNNQILVCILELTDKISALVKNN